MRNGQTYVSEERIRSNERSDQGTRRSLEEVFKDEENESMVTAEQRLSSRYNSERRSTRF